MKLKQSFTVKKQQNRNDVSENLANQYEIIIQYERKI